MTEQQETQSPDELRDAMFGERRPLPRKATIQVEFDYYAAWTDKVAKYPPTAEPFYLALGIADEIGEALEAMGTDNLIPELGDCCWYIARYCTRVLNIRFSIAVATARRMRQEVSITKCVGAIAGIEKKRIRDGETWSEEKVEEKRSAALFAVCQLIWWLNKMAKRKGVNLETVCAKNIEKLSARLDAGTIQGDGDKR